MLHKMLCLIIVVVVMLAAPSSATSPASQPSITVAQAAPRDRLDLRGASSAPVVPTCLYLGPNYTPVQHWTLNASMPTARFGFALIAPNGLSSVYAIGGLQGWTDALTTNERFNACTNTWETLAPLPAPRGYVQAAELNSRIYIVGGVDHVVSDTFGVQNTTWVFDPSHNWWYTVANLPQALGGVAVATANGKLYAFGGFDSRGPGAGDVNTVYEYDPSRDRWSLRSTMPGGARSLAGAAQLNGEVYVAGGVSGGLAGLSRVEVYDPGPRTWRTAQGISDGHYGFTLVAAPDGFLYALGGSHFNNDYWHALQRYDPGADTWSYISTPEVNDYLNHGLSSGAYAAGRLFLMGGVGQIYGTVFSNVNESMRLLDSLCESSIRAAPDSIRIGGYITYTIELHGEVNPLPNVILLDPIPDGTTFAGFIGNPSGASYNAIDDQVEWHNPLPANPTPITITFKVAVNTSGWTKAQFMTNTLFIHNGLNVIARSASTWIDVFDLSMSTKRVDRAAVTAGDLMYYTIRVQTTAPYVGNVTLSDPIPNNTIYVSGSLNSTTGVASYDNGVITWWDDLQPQIRTYTNPSGDYQWGDNLGHGDVPGVKYEWIEIEQTGRPYGFFSPDNDRCYHTAFPFDFLFYDLHRTTASISTNGTMYFPDPGGYTNYLMGWDNMPIPFDYHYSGYDINHFIAPFWDDLYIIPGWIYYQQFGTAPNRQVIIEFTHATRHAGPSEPGGTGSFEMIFYEGSSAIQFQYKDVNLGNPLYDNGASATVGIQGSATNGIQYSFNTPSLSDRLAIVFLPPGRAITYTGHYADITYAVTPNVLLPDRTPITNTVTMTSVYGQVITREAVTLYRVPNFATSQKTVDRSIAQPGEEVTYTIDIYNTGAARSMVQFSDAIPASLTYVSGTLSFPGTGVGSYVDGVINWNDTAPAMSHIPVTFRATVNDTAKHHQVITNTAIVTDIVFGPIYYPQATLTIDKPADLFVAQVAPGTIGPLQTMTYTITYGNHGPFDADDPTTIVDTLPPDLVYVDSSPGGVYSSTTRTVTWNPGVLASGITHTLMLTVLVPESVVPLEVLTNTVSIDAIPQDTNGANNLQQWFTRVGAAPNLLNYTAKTIDPAIASRGDVVTYTILIRNTGNVTATTTITDPIPPGASYQSGSSSIDGTPIELYDAASNQIRWNGSIAPDDEAVICFRAIITTTSVVTNTVMINDGTGLIFDRSVVTMSARRDVFLPVIMK